VSHPFGDLVSQHLHRKHGLSQSKLATGILQTPAVVTAMCQGKRLTGPRARARVLAIVSWLHEQDALDTLNEANALLSAAGMAALNGDSPAEIASGKSLRPSFDSLPSPVSRAWTARNHNLPSPGNALIGRDEDIVAASQMLSRDDVRLITLVGPPGVGKTRLAVEVARVVMSGFADGAWLISLASVNDPQAALVTALQALEAQPAPGLPPLDALKRHLRERKALLVLDNLEQVLDVAPLIADILSAAPNVKILATSREPLRIAAEQRYFVQPLATEPACALFVQRARAVQPDFAPAPEVSDICARLDGLPLAIELAAARVEAFTPKEILARLDKRLATLTAGGRDKPERQRTLRATIEWSYQLLSPGEQAFLRRMSVFAGGFTLHAAQTFCEIDNLPLSGEEGAAALLTKNLLARESQPDGASRYRMLQTIREFALDKLKDYGEFDPWLENMGWYFVALWVPTNQPIPAERDNWRAALEWSQTSPSADAAGLGLLLARSSSRAFAWAEAAGWLEQAVMRPHAHRFPAAQADAFADLGCILTRIGDSRRALAMDEASLNLCRAHDLRFLLNWVQYSLGHAAREAGDYPTARVNLEESNCWARELGAPHEVDYVTLAEVYVAMEDANEAERLLNLGIPLAEAAGQREGLAWALNHLAHVAQLKLDFERATSLLTKSMGIFTDENTYLRTVWGMAWNQQSLGEVALAQGNGSQARAHLFESLRGFDQLGDLMGIAWCLAGLAGAATLEDELQRAARLWGASEGIRTKNMKRIAPASRRNRERTVALLREQLGDERFEAEQAIGRAMTLEQAVAHALDHG